MEKKMKKLALLVLIFFIVSEPLVVVGQDKADSLGIQGNSSEYTFLVDGLKQFPAKYPTSRGYVRATVYGFGVGDPVKEGSAVLESKKLSLVTENGQALDILVVGSEIDLAIFMNEIKPHTGKYMFWYPVLEFKGKYDDWVYGWYEIQEVGRFFIENGDPSDPNKVTGYRNEVYR